MVWKIYYSNQKCWWSISQIPITDTKLYVSVANLSAQDNVKLLQQIKAGFLTNNWLK